MRKNTPCPKCGELSHSINSTCDGEPKGVPIERTQEETNEEGLRRNAAFLESGCYTERLLLRSADELAQLRAERDRLKEFVEGRANCPCCEGVLACLPDCTFENDAPFEFNEMTAAREALNPTKP